MLPHEVRGKPYIASTAPIVINKPLHDDTLAVITHSGAVAAIVKPHAAFRMPYERPRMAACGSGRLR